MIQWPTDKLPAINQGSRMTVNPAVVRTVMETGRVRQRRRFDRSLQSMRVSWRFTAAEYAIFEAFYQHVLEGGTLEFELPLPVGEEMTPVVVVFTGPYEASYAAHETWDVQAVVEYSSTYAIDRASGRAMFGL